jgi:hypothetical protein
MRRAAAIAAAGAVALGIVYVARERTAPAPNEAGEAAPLPSASPPAAPPPVATEAGGRAAASGAPATPSGAQPRSTANIEPSAAASPTTAPVVDQREPQPEVLGEHDDEFANEYLRVAERFRSEPRDPTSAVSLEREILDRFAAITGLAVTTLDVTCRTTTCQVRMVEQPGAEFQPLPGPGGFENLVEGFGTVVSTVTEGDDGRAVFEWLLARDPPPPK